MKSVYAAELARQIDHLKRGVDLDTPEAMMPHSDMLPSTQWPPSLVAITLDGNVVGMGCRLDVPRYPNGVLLTAGHVLKDLRGNANVKLVHENNSVLLPNVPVAIATVGSLDLAGLDLPATLWSLLGVKKAGLSHKLTQREPVRLYGFDYDARLNYSTGYIYPFIGMVLNHDGSTISSWSGTPLFNRVGKVVAVHFGVKADNTLNVAHGIVGIWTDLPESDNAQGNAWKYENEFDVSEDHKEYRIAVMRDRENGRRDYIMEDEYVQVVPYGGNTRYINRCERLEIEIENAGHTGQTGSDSLNLSAKLSAFKHGRDAIGRLAKGAVKGPKYTYEQYRAKQNRAKSGKGGLTIENGDKADYSIPEPPRVKELLSPEQEAEVVVEIRNCAKAGRDNMRELEEKRALLTTILEKSTSVRWADDIELLDELDEIERIINLDSVKRESGFHSDHQMNAQMVVAQSIPHKQLPPQQYNIAVPQYFKQTVYEDSPVTKIDSMNLTTLVVPSRPKVSIVPPLEAQNTSSSTTEVPDMNGSPSLSTKTQCSDTQVDALLPSTVAKANQKKRAYRRSKKTLLKQQIGSSPLVEQKQSESACSNTPPNTILAISN
jgi:hypothetical protein